MGWLEVIALLKRLLPLLGRLAPMLETYIAARGATNGEREALDRLSAEMSSHFAAGAEADSSLRTALETQGERLQKLADELRHLRDEGIARTVQMEQIEQKIASTATLVKSVGLVLVGLLLACGVMLLMLLRR